jgi:hypothetical protein
MLLNQILQVIVFSLFLDAFRSKFVRLCCDVLHGRQHSCRVLDSLKDMGSPDLELLYSLFHLLK